MIYLYVIYIPLVVDVRMQKILRIFVALAFEQSVGPH